MARRLLRLIPGRIVIFALIPLAALNLWRRNRQRTLLTLLAVMTATVVFSVVMVIPFAMNNIVDHADGTPRLAVTNKAAYNRTLPASYYSKIARIPGVLAVSRMSWFGGIYDDPRHQFPNMGIDADNPDQIWPEYAIDRGLVARFKDTRDGAIVGVASMQRFRWHIGDMVSLQQPVTRLTLTFRIVGTINQGPDLTVFLFHRDYLEEAMHNPGNTSMLWVRAVDANQMTRIAATIDEMFRNSSAETRTETEKAFMAQMVSRFRPLASVVQGIGLSAVVAIALAVLNAASMTVRERSREMAVMKSLGFTSGQILWETAMESGVVALTGGIVGILAAAQMLHQIRGFFPTFGPLLSFGLPPQLMAGGLVMAVVVGLAAGILPTASAIRSTVVEGLRRVG
jgi:putative ABC transport system permease protein